MHHIKTVFGDKTDKSHTSVLHHYLLYAVFFRKEDGRECGGMSTLGHGRKEGLDEDKWS